MSSDDSDTTAGARDADTKQTAAPLIRRLLPVGVEELGNERTFYKHYAIELLALCLVDGHGSRSRMRLTRSDAPA